jgi:hypothetical protein
MISLLREAGIKTQLREDYEGSYINEVKIMRRLISTMWWLWGALYQRSEDYEGSYMNEVKIMRRLISTTWRLWGIFYQRNEDFEGSHINEVKITRALYQRSEDYEGSYLKEVKIMRDLKAIGRGSWDHRRPLPQLSLIYRHVHLHLAVLLWPAILGVIW